MEPEQERTDSRARARRIYEILRERICLLDYPPGSILRERDLAAEFGVSRTPIRRVLSRLEHDRLTYSRQGHGTIVTTIDLDGLKDIYFLRIKLAELIGASGPYEPNAMCMETLTALVERCEVAMSRPDFRVFGQINIGLHTRIQGVIRSQPLREFSDQLFFRTARIWFQLLPQLDWKVELGDLQDEIAAIRKYFMAGDVESAGFVHRNHLSRAIKRLNLIVD